MEMQFARFGECLLMNKPLRALLLGFFVAFLVASRAATFTVTTTNDSGAGSFRQAILDANAAAGMDTISFNISPSGTNTISLLTALPVITNSVVIDGTTQPGYLGSPIVELNGLSAPAATDGIKITVGNCTVRGLVINRFKGDGIELATGGTNVIEGCWIGLGLSGTNDLGNSLNGIYVNGSLSNQIGGATIAQRNVISGNDNNGIRIETLGGNRILGNILGLDFTGARDLGNNQQGLYLVRSSTNLVGGTAPGEGNIISGNTGAGILIDSAPADGNVIRGNLIGTDITGSFALGNNADGVRINNVANNTIGGASSAARNVISANVQDGIQIGGLNATNTTVFGNLIGTDTTGTTNLGNRSHGIYLNTSARFNFIGSSAPAAANLIAFNLGDGVYHAGGTNNAIRANIIHSNTGIGIDLGNNGILGNDVNDIDTGSNQSQNFPSLTSANASPSDTVINGTLNSAANTSFEVDFYSNTAPDPLGAGEGQEYLGAKTVTTDGSGNATFSYVSTTLATGKYISATATDPFGNTSEFSTNVIAQSTVPGQTFVVINTNNAGAGSLRQAILDANALFNSGDIITFNIPGTGPFRIAPTNALPTITDKVFIDGYSQPGAITNTLVNGFNANLQIILDGTSAGAAADGLRLDGSTIVVRGLDIILFRSNGILISANASNCAVTGCVVGLGLDGSDQGNTSDGINITSSRSNLIGGSLPGGRNIISGNNRHGVSVNNATATENQVEGNYIGTDSSGMLDRGNGSDGVNISSAVSSIIGGSTAGTGNLISGNSNDGIEINGVGATNNLVLGNSIGSAIDGVTALGNSANGVLITSSARFNFVGGIEGNQIAFNGQDGVTVASGTNNAIRFNGIFSNGNHGIDLGPNGTTANDAGDADIGANNLQNYPVITATTANGSDTIILGTFNGKPNTTFQLDFFSNLSPDSSGFGEGQKYLGSAPITTDANSNAVFNVTLPVPVNGRYISATATDPDGNTSEFARSFRADSTIPPVTLTVVNTNNSGPGSLRQALLDANNSISGTNVIIAFNIPGAGPHTITPTTVLPTPIESVTIDGYTQPGASPNTLADANNAVIKIRLLGGSFFGDGLNLSRSNNVIRGLAIIGFQDDGIDLSGSGNIIEGNFIGIDVDGSPRGNGRNGVNVGNFAASFHDNLIGGATPAARNVISGNGQSGVLLTASTNRVIGNLIGTDLTGRSAVSNFTGVTIQSFHDNIIGGTSPSERNVISGNVNHGVDISGGGTHRVFGNYIGTDVTGGTYLPNNAGINIFSATFNLIGGISPGEANIIAFNRSQGVHVTSGSSASTNNIIVGNSIFSNAALGIDLDSTDVLENDVGDVDEGSNHGQNFPVLSSASAGPGSIAIRGTLNAIPNRSHTVQFYANVTPDPSGNGEGEQFLGETAVLTSANGSASFSITLPQTIRGRFISATATDKDGNTSEFSDVVEASTTFPSETFVVTNTNDQGAGSLRQAVLDNNLSIGGGNNSISFNIPGAGPHTIKPASNLPDITHSVTLDGYTQPGAAANTLATGNNGVIKIILDGSTIQRCLNFAARSSIVRGISALRSGIGIQLSKDDCLVEGCFIGLLPDGTIAGNPSFGVWINASNVRIGNVSAASRNVISGNGTAGIFFESGNTARIINNYIGTDPAGATEKRNTGYGIYVRASGVTIGGVNDSLRNVISGNSQAGILLSGGSNAHITANYIGTDATGTVALPNQRNGIELSASAANNAIGSLNIGEGNIIAGNQTYGISLSDPGTSGNKIQGNYIGLIPAGIALPNGNSGVIINGAIGNLVGGPNLGEGNYIAYNGAFGVYLPSGSGNAVRGNQIFENGNLGLTFSGTPLANDLGDIDIGSNNRQNFPVLTEASISQTEVHVHGILNSEPNKTYTIELFANYLPDATGYGEGQQFLRSFTSTTDATGNAEFDQQFLGYAFGRYITATATDPDGNTSEFSLAFRAASTRPAVTIAVLNTNDSGPGSLRQALLDADRFPSFSNNRIEFNIPGAGLLEITVLTALPSPTESVTIDGFSQPGTAPNTALDLDNAVRRIVLKGGPNLFNDALTFNLGGNVVRGLIIDGFQGNGISLIRSDDNVIAGNLIRSNSTSGIRLFAAKNNLIGGTLPESRNIIIAQHNNGIHFQDACDQNRVLGNFIGVNESGASAPNFGDGIKIDAGGNTIVGGTPPGEGNFIAFNFNTGVRVVAGAGHTIRGNSITANGGYGIDLGPGGVTANDVGDGDTGANLLQNYPVLSAAVLESGGTRVTGVLSSAPSQNYALDFYYNLVGDGGGNGEGLRYLGSLAVTTDANGQANFSSLLAQKVGRGFVSATATDDAGNTSEFSVDAAVTTAIPSETFAVTNTSDAGPGSLRNAIIGVNQAFATGQNKILFNIPGSGVQIIGPASPLPTITQSVFIDGLSQPGAIANASTTALQPVLRIQLDGANAGATANGLNLTSSNNIIQGLIITRFADAGIRLTRAHNTAIQQNFIGTTGSAPAFSFSLKTKLRQISASPSGNGIGLVIDSGNNVIFGNGPGGGPNGNVLSLNIGNGADVINSDNVFAGGNFFGTDPSGALDFGNGGDGLFVRNSSGNIGGLRTTPGLPNLVSGNGNDGISVQFKSKPVPLIISGNNLGSDARGSAPIPNHGNGVTLDEAAVVQLFANAILFNDHDAIDALGTSSREITIIDNNIGITADGSPAGNGGAAFLCDGPFNVNFGQLNHPNIVINNGSGAVVRNSFGVNTGANDMGRNNTPQITPQLFENPNPVVFFLKQFQPFQAELDGFSPFNESPTVFTYQSSPTNPELLINTSGTTVPVQNGEIHTLVKALPNTTPALLAASVTDAQNNGSAVQIVAANPSAFSGNLKILVSGPAAFKQGMTVNGTLSIENTGDDLASVSIDGALAEGMAFGAPGIPSRGFAPFAGVSGTFGLGPFNLKGHEIRNLDVTFRGDTVGPKVMQFDLVQINGKDSNENDNKAVYTTAVLNDPAQIDLLVAMEIFANGPIRRNDNVPAEIQVTNPDPEAAGPTSVLITSPPFSTLSITPTPGVMVTKPTPTQTKLSFSTVPANTIVRVPANFLFTQAGSQIILYSGSSETADPNPDNNGGFSGVGVLGDGVTFDFGDAPDS